ncbi:hypothetical protein NDU88_006816 [Pleurodeles waltl]|uniref:Uncharacterized protein n=1 Tax=Pleurodeles waltl TaxID=8319 RepID=A0AAV7VRQ0_PLEWA|nr:hypothetical protein NDU88_006816 [Pleurodeles waltl]
MSTPSRRLWDNSVLPRHVIPTTLSLLIVHYLEEFYLIRISHLFMLTPYLYFDEIIQASGVVKAVLHVFLGSHTRLEPLAGNLLEAGEGLMYDAVR